MKHKLTTLLKLSNKKRLILYLVLVLLVFILAVITIVKVKQYNQAVDQVGIVSIRELIKSAAEEVKKDAPIDAKTGHTYFPQARLYLPVDTGNEVLTYAYDPENETLSISSRRVFNEVSAMLYGAQNIEELFTHVPKLQACQRGINILRVEDSNNQLKASIIIDGNTTLYIYQDAECPELIDTVELLKAIKTY